MFKYYLKLILPLTIIQIIKAFIYKYNQIKLKYILLPKALKSQKKVISKLKNKLLNKKSIKCYFYVMYDVPIPTISIFENMLNDKNFDPIIVVIPVVSLGEDEIFKQLDKTYKMFNTTYPNKVLSSYDNTKKQWIDFRDNIDMLFISMPYDLSTIKYYRISKTTKALICHITYGYVVSCLYNIFYLSKELNLLWKNFVDSKFTTENIMTNAYNKTNTIFLGFPKMDRIAKIQKKNQRQKTIIIAPHHTIGNIEQTNINFSNFLSYADFFLRLPLSYPNIKFIFRPHPLLIWTLSRKEYWGEEKTSNYIKQMSSICNVEYQDNGDYFDTFINSDGIIQDCGSFMAEYLFTEHPSCYMLKDDKTNQKNYNDFAISCLKNHYIAYKEQDIIDFIDNVIIKENDYMKNQRLRFADTELKLNYPNVSQKIVEYIKMEILK